MIWDYAKRNGVPTWSRHIGGLRLTVERCKSGVGLLTVKGSHALNGVYQYPNADLGKYAAKKMAAQYIGALILQVVEKPSEEAALVPVVIRQPWWKFWRGRNLP